MITNIVAAVTVALVTNVTERFPMHSEPDHDAMAKQGLTLLYFEKQVPDANPTFKWRRTKVDRVTMATYDFGGKSYTQEVGREPVSDVEAKLERVDSWRELSSISVIRKHWNQGLNDWIPDDVDFSTWFVTNNPTQWMAPTNFVMLTNSGTFLTNEWWPNYGPTNADGTFWQTNKSGELWLIKPFRVMLQEELRQKIEERKKPKQAN